MNTGETVIIHYMGQDAFGPFAEVTDTTHSSFLHNQLGANNPHPTNPVIRAEFNPIREAYWRVYAKQFEYNLIKRAQKACNLDYGIPEEVFEKISKVLNIVLPADFVKINEKFRYDVFSTEEFLNFSTKADDWEGIIKNNLTLREKCKRDSKGKVDISKFLVLSFEEYGGTFMITQDSPKKCTPIVSCSFYGMYNYFVDNVFRDPHDEWPSFTAFFEYLVEREEEALKEDGREAE